MIELELLNKVASRVQSDEPIKAIEKEMLLGVLSSVYSYYKQKEDISMLDVLLVLYDRLKGTKTDKKAEIGLFIEHFSAKGLIKLLDELEQKGKRQKENQVNETFINETRMFYKIVANKIKERGIK